MRSQTSEIQNVLDRLDKLERQHRGLKQAALAAVLIIGVVALMSAGKSVPDVVSARGFVLKDANDKTRAQLATYGITDDPMLRLYDERGKERAALYLAFGVPILALSDGNARVEASLTTLMGPHLQLVGKAGNATISSDSDGPNIWLDDNEGFQTIIGHTGLTTPLSGEKHNTSAASIVMVGNDRNHHIIWKAP
jgi:hypothetical protein